MGAAVDVRLLLWCLLVASAAAQQSENATWLSPKFIQPPNHDDFNLKENDQSPGSVIIDLNEHATPIIAFINYKGVEEPKSSEENDLKIKYEWSAEVNYWTMAVTASCDYDNGGTKSFEWTVTAAGELYYVNVNLQNINDNAPQFINTERSCSVDEFVGKEEDYVAQDSTCAIKVRDADGGVTSTVITVYENGEVSDTFTVKATGSPNSDRTEQEYILVVENLLDYETLAVHVLSIEASDVNHTTTMVYVVNVNDLPDTPPKWKNYLPSLQIDEKTSVTETVTAYDGDVTINAPISYRVQATEDKYQQFFEIGETDGVLTIYEIDRDDLKQETFEVVLTAYETDDPSMLVTQTMILIVNDVNDNTPSITYSSESIEVNESYSSTFDFGITITDPDLADNGRFDIQLEDSLWSSAFLVVPGSGYQESQVTISVLEPERLDYEDDDWKTITLTVVATEVANASHVGSKDLTIVLLDINDESPVFTNDTYTSELQEGVDLGTLVITVEATDADAGDVITYSIIPSTQLQVDGSTGEVTVKKALDYESTQELSLQLKATDEVNHAAYADLYLTIIDVNDEQPDINVEPTITSVTEEPAKGLVIAQITASDVDTKAQLELSIDWTTSSASKLGRRLTGQDQLLYEGAFQIDVIEPDEPDGRNVVANLAATGEKDLDWGSLDTIYLTVVVTDTTTDEPYVATKSTKSVQMTITIDDINNKPPQFNQESRLSLKEEDADYTIGYVTATDADGPGNNDITYWITGAEEMYNDLVFIDSITGEMRTIQKIDCDKEGYATINLNVTASDGVHNETKALSIDVTDINDNGPIFGDFDKTVAIPENSEDEVFIVEIIATDADLTSPFNTVSYLFGDSDDSQAYFAVNFSTGLVYVNLADGRVLDRETKDTYYLNIEARDNYVNQWEEDTNSNFTTITVILIDINDNEPTFTKPEEAQDEEGCFKPAGEYISEYMKQDEVIGTVIANDPDEGINGTVSYSIISITNSITGEELKEPLLFKVDESSGNVAAAVDLLDKWGNYDVLFQASDNALEPLSSTVTYTFCVEDENNHDPKFIYPSDGDTIRIRDQQNVGQQLIDWTNIPLKDFEVIDEDDPSTGNGLVSRVDITGGDDEVFQIAQIDTSKYRLTLKQDIVTQADTLFDLQLTAVDGGADARTSTITIQIKVIYITEVPPVFEISSWTASFYENTTEEQPEVIIPKATDPNNEDLPAEDQQPVYYYIIDGDEQQHFILNSTSGELQVSEENPLDYEQVTSHIIYIEATNSPEPPINTVTENNPSVLECLINVIDVNDMPPVFNEDSLLGVFTIDSSVGSVIMILEANDPDVNDTVTFVMKSDIRASSSSLDKVKNNALLLDPDGSIQLNFKPVDQSLDGYLSFDVRAFDSKDEIEGHYADAEVQVYVISNIHRVTFQFLNNQTYIDENIPEMEKIFSDVFMYTCGIETTKPSTDSSSGLALTDTTDVIAHFIDSQNNEPVEKDVITRKFYEQDTYMTLRSQFWSELHLELQSYQEVGNQDATNIEGILTIILIVVSAVLGTMVIVLFVAFFLRTKTLKRRLAAVQDVQFGSQNSGLNRVGVAVPNTNKFAVEGSNPMWKTEAAVDYDNISQGSGDSDMIGIEDNPQFQPSKNNSPFLDGPQPRRVTGILNKEFTFHPEDSDEKSKTESQYLSPDSIGEGKQPRRLTETLNNNFILQYDTDDNDHNQKTQSVNPLANGNLNNKGNYEEIDNYSFKPTNSVPVTEL